EAPLAASGPGPLFVLLVAFLLARGLGARFILLAGRRGLAGWARRPGRVGLGLPAQGADDLALGVEDLDLGTVFRPSLEPEMDDRALGRVRAGGRGPAPAEILRGETGRITPADRRAGR